MSPDQPPLDPDDADLGAALSGLPVPDHGPDFWAELSSHLAGETGRPDATAPTAADPRPIRAQGETTVPQPTGSATDAGPELTSTAAPTGPAPVSLDEQRARRAARRGGRMIRPLGAAAAAVALVVAATGAVAVIRGNDHGHQVRTADRPAGTAPGATGQPGPEVTTTAPPATAPVPAEFSATYGGLEGQSGPGRTWRLTLASDGSFRWTATDGSDDMAYDATTLRQVEIVSAGPGASKARPNAFVTTGAPLGAPDQGATKPDPLGPIGDFVAALGRAGDSRVTATTVQVPNADGSRTARAAWHYDGPVVQDQFGGGSPNHAVADVDRDSGVLLNLTQSGPEVTTTFRASDVTTGDQIDRPRYHLDPPPSAKTTNIATGFVPRTLDQAAADVPYDVLVPATVPRGFTLAAVAVDKDVVSITGAEGTNPPARQVVHLTYRNGPHEFTVTLRPKGADQWDDPFGAEGVTPETQPVNLALPDRPPLQGTVAVDAPIRPHLWGITGDIVVTVSGDLARADLESVAGSLRAHRAG